MARRSRAKVEDRTARALPRSITGGGRARYAFGSTRDPDAWALTADVDVTYTGFFDDLYITKRLSTLVSLAVEARW
jgi:hypothetical protein